MKTERKTLGARSKFSTLHPMTIVMEITKPNMFLEYTLEGEENCELKSQWRKRIFLGTN